MGRMANISETQQKGHTGSFSHEGEENFWWSNEEWLFI
jgi:hypothetical protein